MVEWLTTSTALTFRALGGRLARRVDALARPVAFSASRTPAKPTRSTAAGKWPQGEIVVTLDADTYIEPEALAALRDGFVEDPAWASPAASSSRLPAHLVRPGFFQFFQTFEYARGFLWRLTWMQYDMLVLISGAFAAYRRTVLETAGGFDTTSWVEDYELTHRIYRDSYNSGHPVTVKTIAGARGNDRLPCRRPHLPQPAPPLVRRIHRHPLQIPRHGRQRPLRRGRPVHDVHQDARSAPADLRAGFLRRFGHDSVSSPFS